MKTNSLVGFATALPSNRATVDAGALTMALNVLRRAGKDEVADALEATARRGGIEIPSEGLSLVTEAELGAALVAWNQYDAGEEQLAMDAALTTILRSRRGKAASAVQVVEDEASKIVGRLRMACLNVRTKSAPLSDLIPLMQSAADALEAAGRVPVEDSTGDEPLAIPGADEGNQRYKLPEFITFTGADESTDIDEMLELSRQYPIEWGILFSPKRQGSGRYPPIGKIERIASHLPLRLAAHLCGGDARAVIDKGASPHDNLLAHAFDRVQINTDDPDVQPEVINQWADRVNTRAILQCRASFPHSQVVDYLFDTSGGTGASPLSWPESPDHGQLYGFAGGLNPGNVTSEIARFAPTAGRYWIDMESGVRDEQDRFSLAKCRAVCEMVYGVAARWPRKTPPRL